MQYEIKGGSFPTALCQMRAGETLVSENGAMSWMDPTIRMDTKGGGFGKSGRRRGNRVFRELAGADHPA